MTTASQQIAAVRSAPLGPAALRVDGAVVTYVVGATLRSDGMVSPSDPAGFFVQADRTGPALFVAVNPATLSPLPTPGDRVGFTVTQVSSPTPSTHWAAAVSGYVRTATGASIGALLQDVSGANDLVTGLLGYEHEIITLTGTVTSDFASGGTGFLQASIATAALPADALLKLRLPIDLRTALGLRNGCRFTINAAPMWRYDVTAQASAWAARDVSGVTCPTPDAGTVTDLGPDPGEDRVWVVRVGDGVSTLSGTAVPVNIETYVGAVAGTPIALPTLGSAGNYTLTLSGTAGAEGTLTRSANRAWAVLGGYNLPVGTAVVGSATGQRVIARINAAGTVDTRTLLGTTSESAAIRAAVSVDGSEFWSLHSSGSVGDIVYSTYGATSGVAVAGREVYRGLNLFGAQLLLAGSNPAASGVSATALLPRAPGATTPLLPGFPLNMTLSPYGITAFDRDGNGALDVMFLGDDRALLSGGGMQCWRLIGGTWTLVGNVTGLANPIRALTGRTSGANYVFYAVTAETRARLQRVDVDATTLVGVVTTIAQAPLNTTYRGVSFAPR